MKNELLKLLAKRILKKYHPLVIGITGSVGKTSTKEAIYSVVKQKYRAFQSLRNLNTEAGVPITLLAIEEIPSSKWRWRWSVIGRAMRALLGNIHDYPEVIVVEYGADKPGDIEYLLSIVKPDLAVLTAVSPTHLEKFGSVENVGREKMKLVTSVADPSKRIYNADLVSIPSSRASGASREISQSPEYDEISPRVPSSLGRNDDKISLGVSYGIVHQADIRAKEISQKVDPFTHAVSTLFKIESAGSTVPCELSGVLGNAYVSSALAAVAVGKALGLNMVEIVKGLKKLHGKPGHMRVLGGVKRTTIIDDTYNSSPIAVKHAIDTIVGLEGFNRKWVVLADMLELGADSVKYHQEVGEYIASHSQQSTARFDSIESRRVNSQQTDVIASRQQSDETLIKQSAVVGVDYLVTVGERARDIARGARDSGMNPDHVFDFEDTSSAGRFVQDRIEQGDVILVKGSQGMKMERIVRELMAEPQRAEELLVRRSFGV